MFKVVLFCSIQITGEDMYTIKNAIKVTTKYATPNIQNNNDTVGDTSCEVLLYQGWGLNDVVKYETFAPS